MSSPRNQSCQLLGRTRAQRPALLNSEGGSGKSSGVPYTGDLPGSGLISFCPHLHFCLTPVCVGDILSSGFTCQPSPRAAYKRLSCYDLITVLQCRAAPVWGHGTDPAWLSSWISPLPAQIMPPPHCVPPLPCMCIGLQKASLGEFETYRGSLFNACKWPSFLVSFSSKLASQLEKCKSPSTLPSILHGGFYLIIIALYVAHLLLVRSQLFNSIRYIYTAK